MATDSNQPSDKSPLERFLNLFAPVEAGEGTGAMLLFANVFLLLAAYYLTKTAREPLILNEFGPAMKTYLSAGQALLLLGAVPFYSWLSTRLKRARLLSGISLFFTMNLAVFFALGTAGIHIGMAFYLWVGIFSVFAISQFWAFANDLYNEPQGKRLFPVIGVGSAIGALAGAKAASVGIVRFGPYALMLAASVLLVFCAVLTVLSDRRAAARESGAQAKASQKPLASGDGFAMIFKDRYLVLIAFLVLLLNVVNTSGEFILSSYVTEQAQTLIGAGAEHADARDRFIGAFYGDYFFYVNLLVLILQTFFVARIYRYIGVGGSLFILPFLAFSGYTLLLMAPALGTIRVLKILENSTDYSVQNTTRQALFLPTSREAKYKAKAAIDTFFQRAGDVIQAGIVYVGTNVFALSVAGFAGLNLTLTLVWLGVVTALFFEYKRRTAAAQGAAEPKA